MGWGSYTLEVGLMLDEHGGLKEREHWNLALELARKLRELCESEPYKEIVMDVRTSDFE